MIRRPPRSTLSSSSAASDVYKRQDLYETLGVAREAAPKDIKKAYYKLAMKHHPDRNKAEDAQETFQGILKAYTVLSDPKKREVYDRTGIADDDSLPGNRTYDEWYEHWRAMFSRITVQDIEAFAQKYVGSEMEMEDLKAAYLEAEGDMEKILDSVPMCSYKDEDRFKCVINGWIEGGVVEKLAAFAGESGKKAKRRRKKAQKEEQEANELAKMLGLVPGDEQSLAGAILAKKKERDSKQTKHGEQMDDLANMLAAKYGTGKKKKKGGRGKENSTFSEPSEEEFLAAQRRVEKSRKHNK
eukprot:TRINITY_DN20501_c0_g1_i2.p1 TRINITY_DN20501_c0_g1~~TRINITY_DN20501_c0_g1_i2.p1  ORF type:complete len:299 (+),score=97.62 TRINITY_DN20501_c0_g1_i2:64-960(+)